jgi:rfaE bifunctional protein nucleotidyltransferase chain/domain
MGTLVSVAEAAAVRQALRSQGRTAVLTNGVFDLLHVGHVRCLQAARQLGDMLFVGLNSDESARQLKGPARPLVPQTERAEMLCALASVDYVVIFEEHTAERLVRILQPDIYAKGGDYLPAQDGGKSLPEALLVESYGGCVVLLPYSAGHSTSSLVERILKSSGPACGG